MPEKLSKSTVIRAGKIICAYNREPTAEVREAFLLAHEWRNAHHVPMREIRGEMSRLATRTAEGSVTAGRLKRFQSIRKKMRRRPITLYQMQDIAGCRAILPDMAAVDRLAARYLAGASKHEVVGDGEDYIVQPKAGGYRSRHLVLRYRGPEAVSGGNRLTIELQLRTRAQHGWATAVEAVGLVRREELKSGDGDPRWLRFFELMASEVAEDEGQPLVPGTPACRRERQQEVMDLNRELDALKTLESYRMALRRSEEFRTLAGQSYVILFNRETMSVSVRSASSFAALAPARYDEETLTDDGNIVRVEVDRVSDLKAAYPNYFLDVTAFAERVHRVVGGRRDAEAASSSKTTRYIIDWWFSGKRRGS